MNASYFTVINELFPNAKTIIDPFHLVQLINRSLNKTRIRVMTQIKKNRTRDQKDYTKLKRYWKLLLKESNTLNYTDYYYRPLFKKDMVATEIVDYLRSIDPELRVTYDYYQALLQAYQTKDFIEFKTLLAQAPTGLSPEMTTSVKTLTSHKKRLANTFSLPYSNGPLEGTINKIKVIKRNAFGFRSFVSFRRRILISCRNTQTNSQRHSLAA